MKQKGSLFSGILVFFLVVIILGGVGFLGYNIIFKGNMNMTGMPSMPGMNMNSNSDKDNSTDTNNKDNSNTEKDSSMKDSMNMSNDSSNNKMSMSNDSVTNKQNDYKLSQVNLALQNKDNLDKAVTIINDSLKEMSLDPYAATSQNQQGSNNTNHAVNNNQQNQAAATQGNNTVNVYTAPNSGVMQSMGQSYDPNKMQQLHSGIYKVSVGMQLLDQLKTNMAVQVEQAGIDSKTQSEYYLNQYYAAIQNKNKLSEALNYINEAANLININPYVSANGVAYDKERMAQIHESVYKLAQGVVELNKLNDNLLKQAVQVSNLAQSSASNQTQINNMSNMDMSSGLFSNLSFTTIMTIVLIGFVIVFILALLGSVIRLFKTTNNQE